jgi:hypothetical protein
MDNCRLIYKMVILYLVLVINNYGLQAQTGSLTNKVYFISDCQQPMKAETIRLSPYRNEEARDSLFSDIIHRKPSYLFFLGDITSAGSHNKSWIPIDRFLSRLATQHTIVNAIPGNHEYYTSSRKGIANFRQRFPQNSLLGYCVTIDSMAFVMLNSNINKLTAEQILQQQQWYSSKMDSLDTDRGVKAIIVCLHHSPYTNSTIVSPSKAVSEAILPRFIRSPKARLLMSGHSHNLEYFKNTSNKHFLVLGGGGGLTQPLRLPGKRLYTDLISQSSKPLYFYVTIDRTGDVINLQARGLRKDFSTFYTLDIGKIDLKLTD